MASSRSPRRNGDARHIDASKCPMLPDLSELSEMELARVSRGPMRCTNCGQVLEISCNGGEHGVDPRNVFVMVTRASLEDLDLAHEPRTIRRLSPRGGLDAIGERGEDPFDMLERDELVVTPTPIEDERIESDDPLHGHVPLCRLRHAGSRCSCKRHGGRAPVKALR